ncbi:zf-PARP-domain-containing protein [Trametes coccinea BRFM310]|uniref:Zf-PARP-domain-containing protein n=1 Tax=Trametes coccinea (strain BRFM310) TaxID=1353009 RepID=A0A1Y2INL4_TRAC3|nr:zf-PARP-domain-containing protein [Trametes coccinea BRFM310]
MSEDEGGKKSGYRLEYAKQARAKCTGPKPCKGTKIEKGELRFGSLVDFRGNTSFQWRHWGCVTPKIINNMKDKLGEVEELDGFEELEEEDQERVKKAWEEGHVAPEDVPETARKPEGEEGDDEEKPKKKAGKKKDEDDGGKGVFKFEYASSARSKCKDCGEGIGKDFFRIGSEVDFRGNKSFAWRHWGCVDEKLITKLKASYDEPSQIEGWDELKDGEKEKVQRAWEEGQIPDDDKGAGEAIDTGKKKPAARKKKDQDAGDDDEEKPAKKARAPRKKKDEEMDVDGDEDEKPKKGRGAAKKDAPAAKGKAAAGKKAAAKKKQDASESGEDFGDELAAVDDEQIDEEDEEEPEEAPKKRKRAPASKDAGSKPPSKRAKPASSAKPASKAKPASSAKPNSKAKPASSRGKKKVEEPIEEEDDEDNYD